MLSLFVFAFPVLAGLEFKQLFASVYPFRPAYVTI